MSINNNGPFFRDSITDNLPTKDIQELASTVDHLRDSIPSEYSFLNIPSKVIFDHILPSLNLHEFGVFRCITKKLSQLLIPGNLWRSVIYRDIAFSSKNWAQWNADFVKNVNIKAEMLSLPENIAEELRRSAFPGKSIRETHVLVLMPKGLSIRKLGELAKKYFPDTEDGYKIMMPEWFDDLRDMISGESVWLLMTKGILAESRFKCYKAQQHIVAELAKITGVPYQIPTTLEAATCILAEYSRSKTRLFKDKPNAQGGALDTYTRCQDRIKFHEKCHGYQMMVGGFESDALSLEPYREQESNSVGIAAIRKF